MSVSLFSLKTETNRKSQYDVGVQSFLIIIIFNSGQTLLSDHVCDNIVIAEETFSLETCNLLEKWAGRFLHLTYYLLVQKTWWGHRILSLFMYA